MHFQTAEVRLNVSCPTRAAMDEALETVTALCRARIDELPENREEFSTYLKKELSWMEQNDAAFSLLLQKEIADLSREQGYPCRSRDLGGTVTAFLLGITTIDPLKFTQYRLSPALYGEDYAKGSLGSLFIAETVFPRVAARLTAACGHMDAEPQTVQHLTLSMRTSCEKIGRLFHLTGKVPAVSDFDSDICVRALKRLASHLDNDPVFAAELKTVENCDFYTLSRLFAYAHGCFSEPRTLRRFYDPAFFATREELYALLVAAGVPSGIAAKPPVCGVWSTGDQRQRYADMPEDYPLSAEVKQYFHQCEKLRFYADSAAHAQVMCTREWYELHFPEAFAQVEREVTV